MNTTQPVKSRRQKLQEFLSAHPEDAFARYGLAIECAREGDNDAALNEFASLLKQHPDYVTGYFQFGQLLAKIGRTADARRTLTEGIEAAKRAGNEHAQSEMAAALAELPA